MLKIIENFVDSQYFIASCPDSKGYFPNSYTKLLLPLKVQYSEADCPLLRKLHCNDLIVQHLKGVLSH